MASQSVWGQGPSSTQGTIVGTVTDSSGAVLPNVKVSLTGAAVMGTQTTVTDQNGVYRLPALPPGDYQVVFEHEGFGTVTRPGIHIDLGFTATVDVKMSVGAVSQNVVVEATAPIIDLQSASEPTTFSTNRLESLPGSRDYWAVVAQAPAVSMSRMDVGGSNALTQQPYTAYGLTSAGGVNRGEVEGIMVNEGAGGGGSDFFYLDYGSMAEVSINAVGNSAQMPNPGVLTQFIAKTGGNQYHGDVYFDYESDALESTNIDKAQIARGLTGSSAVSVYDLNRLSKFKDFDADLGGYIIKDKLWWYGAYRHTSTSQRYPTLLDDVQVTTAPVYSGKATYNITQNQRISGYYTHENKTQPDYLGAIFISGGRQTPALMHQNSVWYSTFPLYVWAATYDWVISPSLVMEVRAGQYHSVWSRSGKSPDPRIEDLGNNFVSGGVYGIVYDRSRPQVNGSISYNKSGWLGTHAFKFGGEYMRDSLSNPYNGFPNACNCVSILNNNVPLDVYLYSGPNTSKDGLSTVGLYANDTWQLNRRLTLNLGVRYDRQNVFLPSQTGPAGQHFAAVGSAIVWNNLGPRVGVTYDVTGHGNTVLKASFGQFYLYPGADFAANINPNPAGWYTEYTWTDTNKNGVFDPGEQGRVIASSGGTASTTFDKNLKNTYTLQSTAYLERQIASTFSVRSGFVWNGRREVRGNINVNRPYAAYNVPITITDPGPDGKVGTADDGPQLTAYGLNPAFLALPVVNLTTNLPENSNYFTWEITAIKREAGGRWSLLATFAKIWARETSLGTGSSFTPNQAINTEGGLNVYNTWQGKLTSTVRLPWHINLTPIVRVQSGTPYGRTFVSALNYGSATILAEPYNTHRTDNIGLFDIRAEKQFRIKERFVLTGFFDVYNIFNTNANQAITTSSGSSFLRPVAITPPRIARLGVKFQF